MKQLKRQIKKALATYGGRITRFFNNLEAFDARVPQGASIACASYAGRKLAVTYTERSDA